MTLIAIHLFSFDLYAIDESNIGSEWQKWLPRFENFLGAFDGKDNARRQSLPLHYAGERVYDISETLPDLQIDSTSSQASTSSSSSTPPASSNPNHVLKDKLNAYFNPRTNTALEIFQFRQAIQLESESIGQFCVRLWLLAFHCEFTNTDVEVKKPDHPCNNVLTPAT